MPVKLSFWGLKPRITAAVLVVFLTTTALLTYVVQKHLDKDMRELLDAQHFSAVSYMASELDEKIRFRMEILAKNASDIPPELFADPESAKTYFAEHFKNRFGLISLFKDGVILIDKDGLGVADYPVIPGRTGASYQHREYFKEVTATKNITVGEPIMGRFSKDPGLPIAAPIFGSTGELAGMLAGFATLSDSSLFGQVENARVGMTGYIAVEAPKYGLIVISSDPKRVMDVMAKPGINKMLDRFRAGFEGAGITVNSRNMEVLTAGKHIPSAGWIVQMVLPTAEAFQPIHRMKMRVLLMLTGFSVLVIVLTWLIVDRQLRPLGKAAGTIKKMTSGEAPFHEFAVSRQDEIGDLLASFNMLFAQRTHAEAELQDALEFSQAVLNSTSFQIAVIDQDGRILAVNHAWKAFALQNNGNPSRTGVGMNYLKVCRSAGDEAAYQGIKSVLDGTAPEFTMVYPCDSPDEERYFRMQVVPLRRHKSGAVIAHVDITSLKKTQESLHLARQLQQNIFDHIPQRVFWKDLDLNYLGCNQSFAYDSGIMDPAEIVGKTDFDLAWKDLAELYRSDDRKVLKTGESKLNFEEKVIRPDGSVFWVLTNKVPLLNPDGTFFGVLGTYQDITDRKRAEDQIRMNEKRLESIVSITQSSADTIQDLLDQALDAAVAMTHSRIGYIYRYDGETHEFTLNSYSKDVMKECAIAQPRTLYQLEKTGLWGEAFRQGKPVLVNDFQGDNPLKKGYPEGHVALIRFLTVPVYSHSRIVGVVGVGNKATDYDQTDVLQLTLLSDAVWKLADRIISEQALREARDAAETASRVKSEFLANMSHEIRTPMNAIIGLGHLALQTDLTPKQKDYLTKISSSAQSLLSIINDILDFSKIEAGRLEMEFSPFDLGDTLGHIGTLVSVSAEEKGLEVMFNVPSDVPRALIGDSMRLGQILANLVNNAVKFTEKGEIVISCEMAERGDDFAVLRFSVRDSGIGMTAAQIATLFNPFMQADSSITRKYGGTGLGLTICRHLVELMKGEIHVDSIPGKGSTFVFTVHFGLQADESPRCLVPPSDLRGLHVLVVDDNAVSREILRDMLASFSFDITEADSGHAAIAELERTSRNPEGKPISLVLMDWKMPGMDGFEATRLIRGNESSHAPVVIMISAFGREEMRHKAEALGLSAFLTKPVQPSALYNAILEAFGTAQQTPQSGNENPLADEWKTLRGARILVVEDHELNQQVAREVLEGGGMTVSLANNGRDGVAAVFESPVPFDAVLMDLQMPEMDGYEATRLIREKKNEWELPIIAMTAHAMSDERLKCLAAGMNDHIAKPFQTRDLFEILGRWIHSGRTAIEPDMTIPARTGTLKPEDLPDLPGINIPSALSRINGNVKLFRDLVTGFCDEHRNTAEDLKQAIFRQDYSLAKTMLHPLKSTTGNIGATDLHLTVKCLEDAILSGNSDNLHEYLPVFEMQLHQILNSSERLRSGKSPERGVESGEYDSEGLKEATGRLMKLLAGRDLSAMSAFEQILGKAHDNMKEDLADIESHMKKLDYPAALEKVRKLVKLINN